MQPNGSAFWYGEKIKVGKLNLPNVPYLPALPTRWKYVAVDLVVSNCAKNKNSKTKMCECFQNYLNDKINLIHINATCSQIRWNQHFQRTWSRRLALARKQCCYRFEIASLLSRVRAAISRQQWTTLSNHHQPVDGQPVAHDPTFQQTPNTVEWSCIQKQKFSTSRTCWKGILSNKSNKTAILFSKSLCSLLATGSESAKCFCNNNRQNNQIPLDCVV